MDLIAGLANAILVICVRNLGARVASRVALTSTLIPLIVKFGVLIRRPMHEVTTLAFRKLIPMKPKTLLLREDVAFGLSRSTTRRKEYLSQAAIGEWMNGIAFLCLFRWRRLGLTENVSIDKRSLDFTRAIHRV